MDIYIFKAINGVHIVHKVLDFGDAFISECVIAKNVFWQNAFISVLCVKKSFDRSFFRDNFSIFPVWYNTNKRVGKEHCL